MAPEALAAPRGPLASRGNEMQPESTTVASPRRRTRRSRADERAYETFHASHYRELAAYCMTDLRNWAEAEEVAADALIVLWRNWLRLRSHDTRTLQAYVFQVARRRLLHVGPKLRRQRQQTAPLGWAPATWTMIPPLSILPAATTARKRWTGAWR